MHVSVMVHEMLDVIQPFPGGTYLDGTLGAGGYAEAILDASTPGGRVFGFDVDREAIVRAKDRLAHFKDRFHAVHAGFHDAPHVLESLGIGVLDGAVLDLGLSSDQLDAAERGFSFMVSGPLDMRFDAGSGETALAYLAGLSAKQLEEILATYGQERYCKKLARAVVDRLGRGEIETTGDLARLITRILGNRRGRIHPATRTFQALRIAVNREMENLSTGLERIPLLLREGGRFCVVSYHSLEDGLVKRSFRERTKVNQAWRVLTPKPLRPTAEEVKMNPRARSAMLRALEAAC